MRCVTRSLERASRSCPHMTELRIKSLSDRALTVEVGDATTARGLADHLRGRAWIDVVAGLESVAVFFDPASMNVTEAQAYLARQIETFIPDTEGKAQGAISIPVRYGGSAGPDLPLVAERAGFSEGEVIERHRSSIYTVSIMGFLPGFAYLEGLDEKLATQRRAQPRPRVAAGSVGIGGEMSGIYSLPGPGGWNIIGRTNLVLFSPQTERLFALKAGMQVRFEPV